MKKDLNEIAKYENAISKKYGKEATQHPKADWDDEKEEDYQKHLSMILLDWEKAFDKISHEKLIEALERVNIPKNLLE